MVALPRLVWAAESKDRGPPSSTIDPHESREPFDFHGLIAPVADRLLGEPNAHLSRGTRLRFGSRGSMEIDTAEGWFDDHEANVRGGVLDLIRHKQGCDIADAFRWLEGQGLKEARPARGKSSAIRSPDCIFYDYADEDGQVLFRVERRGKDAVPPFLQHGPDGRGGFHASRGCMQGVRRVLYRLPELLAAPDDSIVFVCEGEKDADALAALGFVATTNPGGAGKFTAAMAKPLVARIVVVLQDNDEPGAKHVAGVLAILDGVAARAAPLAFPSLPEKGDVSDMLRLWGHNASFELKSAAERALESAGAPPATFPIANLAAWANTPPEPKQFVMAGFIPEHEVTLFTGAGGTNKSTLGLQLCACSAAGLPLLGVAVQPGPALYVTAEDDDRENHWRLAKIAGAINKPVEELVGRLHVVTLRGRLNNELATFGADGRLRPTEAFKLLRSTIEATGSKLLVLDNIGHLYVGNENDRGQVTVFINLLYQLCRELGVTVVLIGHPNKAGDAYSGSTAWPNSVRSHIVIACPDDGLDCDARNLTVGKANYARRDQRLSFRWHDFALIRDDDLPDDKRAELSNSIIAAHDNKVFLACLAKATGQNRAVSHIKGTNYAPTVFAGMIEAKGTKASTFASAMERLWDAGTIKFDQPLWQDAHRHRKQGIKLAVECGAPPAATPCGDLREPSSQEPDKAAATPRAAPPPILRIDGARPEVPAAPLTTKQSSNRKARASSAPRPNSKRGRKQ